MQEDKYWEKEPENTYGMCKLMLLEHLKAQQVMKWVYLVPPNIYGPGDHFGQIDAHLIPATVMKFEEAVANGSSSISVWGDGTQTRDFVYIDDIVEIAMRATSNPQYFNRIVNLATSTGVTVKEIVLSIRKCLELENIEITWDTTKPTGTMMKVLSNDVLMDIEPGYSMTVFNEGIIKTIDWYKRRTDDDNF